MLRNLLRVVLAVALFMLANTVYLLAHRFADAVGLTTLATGDIALPKLFQAMVLTHTGAGLVLALIGFAFVAAHLPRVWRRRHRASIISGAVSAVAAAVLVVTGLFILTAAASRDHRWVWWAHVICAALVPAAYVAHRVSSVTSPTAAAFRRYGVAVAAAAAILVVGEAVSWGSSPDLAGPDDVAAATASYGDPNGFEPIGFASPASRFFPSPATTASGAYAPLHTLTGRALEPTDALREEVARFGFARDTAIGAANCGRCHADIVAQWSASAHRFASFNNPFYEATVRDMRANATESNAWIDRHRQAADEAATVGAVKSRWCAGCHDPALLFTGRMNGEIDRGTVAPQAGLTCLACHVIDSIHDRTGNGNYTIDDRHGDPYLFAGAADGTLRAWLHDAVVKSKPTVHRQRMLTPVFRRSEYCATCHKVSLPQSVNNYRWLRGQNEFDNWDDSGVALNASRTFYLPPARRECQDCHMPPEPATRGDVSATSGTVRSHRFLAVNTALPFLRGDRETIDRIEAFLQDEKLSVDIFAVTAAGRTTMGGEQPVVLPVGRDVTFDVVVRNRGVGHTFPGGTNDSNEGWLEFTVMDDAGRTLATSGAIGDDGHLDPTAHVYKAVLIDAAGEPIGRRNAQDIRATVFANTIGPGTADLAHYRFPVPSALAGRTVTVRARLLWRKFDRGYTAFAFDANPEGFPAFDAVPDLPVTEIAAAELQLAVAPGAPVAPEAPHAAETDAGWMRYNDYGIGLLLEGDTRRAAVAFERVAELRPDGIDGPLNLAKTALQDGNVERAYAYLDRVEAIAPGDYRAAWVWGVALQEDGEYERAIQAYRRVLERFPGDRAAWRNLGRTYYLDGQYDAALDALDEVLQIDPEDRIAHYHRMLSFRALGRTEAADRAAAAAEYYSIDESAQELTRRYRLEHPGANLMAQPIRTHLLELKTGAR